jgi:hypothetical protein
VECSISAKTNVVTSILLQPHIPLKVVNNLHPFFRAFLKKWRSLDISVETGRQLPEETLRRIPARLAHWSGSVKPGRHAQNINLLREEGVRTVADVINYRDVEFKRKGMRDEIYRRWELLPDAWRSLIVPEENRTTLAEATTLRTGGNSHSLSALKLKDLAESLRKQRFPTNHSDKKSLFKELWALRLCPRAQEFMWRAITGQLPVVASLPYVPIKRCPQNCPKVETVGHVFECESAREILGDLPWRELATELPLGSPQAGELAAFQPIRKLDPAKVEAWRCLAELGLHESWLRRCHGVFNEEKRSLKEALDRLGWRVKIHKLVSRNEASTLETLWDKVTEAIDRRRVSEDETVPPAGEIGGGNSYIISFDDL